MLNLILLSIGVKIFVGLFFLVIAIPAFMNVKRDENGKINPVSLLLLILAFGAIFLGLIIVD